MCGLDMKYFVLKPRSKNGSKNNIDHYALASRMAMIAYAQVIEDVNPKLADDLMDWVNEENERDFRMI